MLVGPGSFEGETKKLRTIDPIQLFSEIRKGPKAANWFENHLVWLQALGF